jgi:hypothetical protein
MSVHQSHHSSIRHLRSRIITIKIASPIQSICVRLFVSLSHPTTCWASLCNEDTHSLSPNNNLERITYTVCSFAFQPGVYFETRHDVISTPFLRVLVVFQPLLWSDIATDSNRWKKRIRNFREIWKTPTPKLFRTYF